MINYKNSDYAVNKFADGIVYRFNGQTLEVTLNDYLAENPDKTEADFRELKALSDTIYHEQVRDENTNTRLDVSIHGMEESQSFITSTVEDDFAERQERNAVRNAARQLLESGELTETQERRFRLHFFDGLSLREIANIEGTSHPPVHRSINAATKKLKIFFDQQG